MGKMVRYVKLVGFCGLVLFVVTACSMLGESTPPPAPAGPVVVNNMPPAAAPAQDGNVPWLMMFAIVGVAGMVWLFRDGRDARARAETAERVLERHLILTGGAVTSAGRYLQPSANALQPAHRSVPMLEPGMEVGR